MTVTPKEADLAGPGIGDYADLERILPTDYEPLLTMRTLYEAKRLIEDRLCETLNLTQVQVPLDRDGSRTPVGFHISNDRDRHPIDAEVFQAATKWKRMALRQFGMKPGKGLLTDMRAVRKDYFLDHDHSAYVDQWDWEKAILPEQRTLELAAQYAMSDLPTAHAVEAALQERFQPPSGAKRTDPGVTTLNAYAQSFSDPAKCHAVAAGQIGRGAGVVFGVAGACSLGALQAAKEKGVWGIGVDTLDLGTREGGSVSTVVPTRERERHSWTSEYWLDHCEGFRVETSKGRLGFVEEVIWDPENGEPTALLVRKSQDGFDLTAVPIAQVREVHPEIEELDVGDTVTGGVERP